MKRIFISVLQKILGFLGKRAVIIEKNKKPMLTASYCPLGFWYVGDVFDSTDIAYGIAKNGIVESEDTNLVVKIIREMNKEKGVNFYDIGANTGYYGVLTATLNKEKNRIFSFEPISEHVNFLNRTILLNNLKENFRVFSLALSNKNQEDTLMQICGSGSSLNFSFNDNDNLPTTKVVTNRLDDLLKKENIPLPDFIKIDVEGHEYEVLEGALETIKSSSPVLFIEIARTLNNLGRNFENKNYENIFNLLKNIGYSPFCLSEGRLTEYDFSEKKDGVFMYLFLTKKDELLLKILLNEKFN